MASAWLVSSVMCLLLEQTVANLPFWEKEAARHANFNTRSWAGPAPNEDFSFTNPFDIIKATTLQLPSGPKIREDISLLLYTVLNGADDVDVLLLNKTSSTETGFIGFPSLPACQEYLNFFPSIALLGPVDTLDVRTGLPVFTEDIPLKVQRQLPPTFPKNYKARVVTQKVPQGQDRPWFFDKYTDNDFFLPYGFTFECSGNPDLPECSLDNVIYTHINQPALYYWAVWNSGPVPKGADLLEVPFVTGTTDGWYPSDYARYAAVADFIGGGRWLNNKCSALSYPPAPVAGPAPVNDTLVNDTLVVASGALDDTGAVTDNAAGSDYALLGLLALLAVPVLAVGALIIRARRATSNALIELDMPQVVIQPDISSQEPITTPAAALKETPSTL